MAAGLDGDGLLWGFVQGLAVDGDAGGRRDLDVDLADLARELGGVLLGLVAHGVGDLHVCGADLEEQAEVLEGLEVMSGELLGAREVVEDRRRLEDRPRLLEFQARRFGLARIRQLEPLLEPRLRLPTEGGSCW